MPILFVSHPGYVEHDPGRGHPERPERLVAVEIGAELSGLDSELVRVAARPATEKEIERVHTPTYVGAGAVLPQRRREPRRRHGRGPRAVGGGAAGGGRGLAAIERLEAGDGTAAFCAVRPGHHALPARAMGFCLFNNVAVSAAALADGASGCCWSTTTPTTATARRTPSITTDG